MRAPTRAQDRAKYGIVASGQRLVQSRKRLRVLIPNPSPLLDVEVQAELVGVRTQLQRLHLVDRLVPDPGVDHVGREDVAAEQELVVARNAFKASSNEPGACGTFFISSGSRS